MIDNRSIQLFLAEEGFYDGPIEATYGAGSDKAARAFLVANGVPQAPNWPARRRKVAVQQAQMAARNIEVGPLDGLVGPSFRYALEVWQNRMRDGDPDVSATRHQPRTWPRQNDVPGYFGAAGQRQVMLRLAYPMKLAWDPAQEIHRFSIHAEVAESAGRVFGKTLAHYGIERIRHLRLDRFGGCLNVRTMRGSASRPSMHSWGIAIDLDPERNQLRWGRERAHFARADYKPFLDFWEAEGWISIGRERNYDWMHVQAARL